MTETKPIRSRGRLLVEHQHLATSGARAALAFVADAELRLAIPQLAVDLPGMPANVNGGAPLRFVMQDPAQLLSKQSRLTSSTTFAPMVTS